MYLLTQPEIYVTCMLMNKLDTDPYYSSSAYIDHQVTLISQSFRG